MRTGEATMTATTIHPPVGRGRRRWRAAATLLEATTAIVAIPVFLVVTVGWPLPHTMPTWQQIHTAYQLRDVPDRLVLGGLACALWLCWAAMIVSFLGNAVARARATEFHRPRLIPSVI